MFKVRDLSAKLIRSFRDQVAAQKMVVSSRVAIAVAIGVQMLLFAWFRSYRDVWFARLVNNKTSSPTLDMA